MVAHAAAIVPTFLTAVAGVNNRMVERKGTSPLPVASEKLHMEFMTFHFILGGLTPS